MKGDVEIRPYRAGDDEAFVALHERTFDDQWNRAWWDWRFHAPPRGSEILGTFAPDGRCLAMYAGVRHRMLLRGEECDVLQQSDVALAPELREGLGGTKLLGAMARRFFDTHGGGSTRLMYGFPVPGLRRIVGRFNRSEVLMDVVFLADEVGAEADEPPTDVRLASVAGFGRDADELWAGCASELSTAICRDARYLNWRYRDHPGVDYELLEARDASDGSLRGLAVLREGGWDPAIASISEWLVPSDDTATELALVAAARRYAREHDRRFVVAWFPSFTSAFLRFQRDHGFFARSTPYQELFRSWCPGVDRDWLHEHWYQTMGDIDFF